MSGSVTHNTQKTEFWQYWQIWYWVTHILHTILRITMSVFGSQTKTVQLSRVSELCTRVSFQCQMNHCFWINWLNIWFSDSLHIKTFYLLPPTGGWMNYSILKWQWSLGATYTLTRFVTLPVVTDLLPTLSSNLPVQNQSRNACVCVNSVISLC